MANIQFAPIYFKDNRAKTDICITDAWYGNYGLKKYPT